MITRVSPVTVPEGYVKKITEEQAGWQVLQSVELFEIADVLVCDLSHRPKAIALGPDIEKEGFPDVGKARWNKTAWYARLNPNEGYYYDLLGELHNVRLPESSIDMTDAWALLAIFGPQASNLMGRLVAVDVDSHITKEPIFLITKAHNAAVQIVNMQSDIPGYLISCERSFGQALYDFCLHGSSTLKTRPAGERDFQNWMKSSGLK
jgi:hypothetical protein